MNTSSSKFSSSVKGMLKIVLSILTVSAFTAPGFAAPVSNQDLVGKWEMQYQKSDALWSKIWNIKSDGKFEITDSPANGGDSFSSTGEVTFTDSRCILKTSTEPSLSASYHLKTPSLLVTESTLGVSNWRKVTDDSLNEQLAKASAATKLNNMAVALFKSGKSADAIKKHMMACATDPTNPVLRRNLSSACLQYGELLRSKKEYESASDQFRQAILADPNNQDAIRFLQEVEGHH